MSPKKIVNQFPGEQVVTVKDLLASLASLQAKRARASPPSLTAMNTAILDQHLTTDWYPVTFNLVYELPQFVAYYQKRQVGYSFIRESFFHYNREVSIEFKIFSFRFISAIL